MPSLPLLPFLLATAATAAAAPPSPLRVTTSVAVERPVAAPDGTTRLVAVAGVRARPGDRLVVTLAYRNAGSRPIADLVLADPVPRELTYRSPAPGTPGPELSIDGAHFGPLASLALPQAGGAGRPAVLADVVAVRWRLPGTLAPGAGGTVAFRAVLK